MSTATSEQRTSQRVPSNTPIRFRLAHPEDLTPTDANQDATLVDISATGMGIHTSIKLHAGQYILFDKDQPNWQLPPRGQVIWCLQGHGGFRAGIEFSM